MTFLKFLLVTTTTATNSTARITTKMSNKFILNLMRLIYFEIVFITIFMGYANAKIGYFWHISDLHLDTLYSTKGDIHKSCWKIDQRQTIPLAYTRPGRFGDYLCDSPWSLLESATIAMKSRQGDNVEFVLWTGDGLSDSSRRMLEPHRIEILRNITDLLSRTFSSQFVFPVLGHNDGPDISFRRLGELWRHWLPSEALQTFEKGGYYSIEQTKSRLRIIALNTNFMQHDPTYSNQIAAAVRKRHPNPHSNMGGSGSSVDSNEYKNYYYHHGGGSSGGSSSSSGSYSNGGYNNGGYNSQHSSHHYNHGDLPNGYNGYGSSSHHHYSGSVGGQVSALSGAGSGYDNQDTQKQWDWLEDVLAKSKANKETVYIVGHMPPGSDERIIGASQQHGHTTFSEKNNLRYLRLVRKYSSIIQGQFFGHLHSDSFRIIYDEKGKPVSWIMVSPSVTPRKMSVGSNNPAMRLYKFDTDSGQVLDYTQYYLDLNLANSVGDPNWMSEYNLTHYYGLNEVSALTLHNLADRFTVGDSSWFPKYLRANTVRYQQDTCDGYCILNHYCAVTRVDYMEFRQCLEKEQSALRSSASNGRLSKTTSPLILYLISIILLFIKSTSRQLFLKYIMVFIINSVEILISIVYKILKPKICFNTTKEYLINTILKLNRYINSYKRLYNHNYDYQNLLRYYKNLFNYSNFNYLCCCFKTKSKQQRQHQHEQHNEQQKQLIQYKKNNILINNNYSIQFKKIVCNENNDNYRNVQMMKNSRKFYSKKFLNINIA